MKKLRKDKNKDHEIIREYQFEKLFLSCEGYIRNKEHKFDNNEVETCGRNLISIYDNVYNEKKTITFTICRNTCFIKSTILIMAVQISGPNSTPKQDKST